MGKVFVDMAVSLDGFISGPNGEDWGLHDWYFAEPDEHNAPSHQVIDELLQTIGAMIMGKKVFGTQPDGFDTPYKVSHFVLTHEARDSVSRDGVTFAFVSDGIESALEQARTAAGDKDICIAGGADTVQQYLKAGLVDEIHLHVVSKIFGGGTRLFDHLGSKPIDLERTRVIESVGVTHLRFQVVR
jgi:dihydrofolate reductase